METLRGIFFLFVNNSDNDYFTLTLVILPNLPDNIKWRAVVEM